MITKRKENPKFIHSMCKDETAVDTRQLQPQIGLYNRWMHYVRRHLQFILFK